MLKTVRGGEGQTVVEFIVLNATRQYDTVPCQNHCPDCDKTLMEDFHRRIQYLEFR